MAPTTQISIDEPALDVGDPGFQTALGIAAYIELDEASKTGRFPLQHQAFSDMDRSTLVVQV